MDLADAMHHILYTLCPEDLRDDERWFTLTGHCTEYKIHALYDDTTRTYEILNIETKDI